MAVTSPPQLLPEWDQLVLPEGTRALQSVLHDRYGSRGLNCRSYRWPCTPASLTDQESHAPGVLARPGYLRTAGGVKLNYEAKAELPPVPGVGSGTD